VAHQLLEEKIRGRGQAHRRAGVTVTDLLDGISGQNRMVSTARWSSVVQSRVADSGFNKVRVALAVGFTICPLSVSVIGLDRPHGCSG